MNDEEISKMLKDHEKRISALETVFKLKRSQIIKGKKSLPDYIIELRGRGFFSQPMTILETHGELQGVYPCEVDRVTMALLRLSNKKQLRKAYKMVSGEKLKAYVW